MFTTLSNEVPTLNGEESLRHIGGHLVCLDVTADLIDQVWDTLAGRSSRHV